MDSKKKQPRGYEIIDFHTHIFPDAVAKKAADNVGNYYSLPMHGDGTKNCLLSGTNGLNVSHFVISSAALNPLKTVSVNDFIFNSCMENPSFIGFGSVHRDTPEVFAEIERIISMGLHGIKLHPDFQGFDIDDEKMFPIYERLEGRLPVLFHVGDTKSDKSNPKRLFRVMQKFPSLTVIAAHMGGYTTYELAKEYLVGTRAYFDTSDALRYIEPDELVKTIRLHGVEKIFFGSDFPLLTSGEAAEEFYTLSLSEEEFKAVFAENAKSFFGI